MLYTVNLDITPGGMPPVLHMSQYDTGRIYEVHLKDGGGDFTPGLGTTAKVKGFNGKVAFEIAATVSSSTVTFQLTDASTDQFGIFPVTIEMTIGSTVLSPLCMIFDVQMAGLTNEQAASSPEFENAMEEAAQKYVLGMDLTARTALLDLLSHVAYIDQNGQDYYDALELALRAKLSYIVADYAQDHTVYTDDSLDSLKEGDELIVTAYYDDGSHIDLSDSQYTLSGTLTAGTSTITVSCQGKTDTFDVTVTAPLYSIPDFAAQTLTSGGKSISVKKENGVYTLSGAYSDVVYILPNGTASLTKSNTLWFSSLQDKSFVNRAIDVQYTNAGSVALTFCTKLAQSDNTGNLASTSLSMAANSSGTESVIEFSNDAYNARNMSCFACQILGTRSYSATVSFKVRMFCDGVRYL